MALDKKDSEQIRRLSAEGVEELLILSRAGIPKWSERQDRQRQKNCWDSGDHVQALGERDPDRWNHGPGGLRKEQDSTFVPDLHSSFRDAHIPWYSVLIVNGPILVLRVMYRILPAGHEASMPL